MQNPRQYKIPDWFLNRQKDIKDGKYSQKLANDLNITIRGTLQEEGEWVLLRLGSSVGHGGKIARNGDCGEGQK